MNADLPSDPNLDIDRLKRQAKQRFIGAAVLVLIAVIGLPFLLDSQPRSLSSNISIDIPKMESAAPATPAAPTTAPLTTPAAAPESAPTPAPTSTTPAPAKNTQPVAPLVFASDDGKRAAALLSGQTPATTSSAAPNQKGKFVVQAGSYTEEDKLAAARAKLDKAGLANYTQPAPSRDGISRTRLRLVGPFSTKEEAQAAQTKVTQLGIAAMVLKP